MAGTSSLLPATLLTGHLNIILVRPQMGENIGMAIRAMVNCGLTSLRLVAPRDGWPSDSAQSASAGGLDHLAVSVFPTLAEAIADLSFVVATTARPRTLAKPALSHPEACETLTLRAKNNPVGLLFGPEKAGLTNDDVALADATVTLDLNPAFASLNLAQAVFVFAFALWNLRDMPRVPVAPTHTPAPKKDWLHFFDMWEAVLIQTGFLHLPEKRDLMIRNLRTMLMRGQFSHQEIQTLHGVFRSLLMADGKQGWEKKDPVRPEGTGES
ncbi:MAG: RNA methyltransferase [Alphaproteobacteria bacterium]